MSNPVELRLTLRWIAILRPQLGDRVDRRDFWRSTRDRVVKALMAASDVAMLTSSLLRHGPDQLRAVETALATWMVEHDYVSVEQLRGSGTQG